MEWSDRFIVRCLWVEAHPEEWPDPSSVALSIMTWEWDDDHDRTNEVEHRFVLPNDQAQNLALSLLEQVTLNEHERIW